MTVAMQERTDAAKAYRGIYEQYADEASFLWLLRSIAVDQPHYTPADIGDLERRIQANLDGLMTNLELGWTVCENALELEEPGEVFAAAVTAFRSRDMTHIQQVVEVALADPRNAKALISALGWLPGSLVHSWIKKFFTSKNLDHKYLAVAACSVRRENPGEYLNKILGRDDCLAHERLHARSLRIIGELKRRDLAPALQAGAGSDSDAVKFHAFGSAVLLGDRAMAARLEPYAMQDGPFQQPALQLALRALPVEQSRAWISQLAQAPDQARNVIEASAALGDPQAVNWLIAKMKEPELARLAGEAFTTITGVDLEKHELAIDVPEDITAIPNNDPEDEDVSMDEDENLPWPDPDRVAALWHTYSKHFPPGRRFFMGQPVNKERLAQIIQSGYQRQRQAAAVELALLEPQSLLINSRATVDR
jgi:uncharacterized protein (TIGR02270 family)